MHFVSLLPDVACQIWHSEIIKAPIVSETVKRVGELDLFRSLVPGFTAVYTLNWVQDTPLTEENKSFMMIGKLMDILLRNYPYKVFGGMCQNLCVIFEALQDAVYI